MSGLSDTNIHSRLGTDIHITPFKSDNLQPASYDLSVGLVFQAKTRSTHGRTVYVIGKGEAAAILTDEKIYISREISGHVDLRNELALKGLLLLNPGHIDPGWGTIKGGTIVGLQLTAIVRNISDKDIDLPHGMTFLTMTFSELKTPTPNPYVLGMSEQERTQKLISTSQSVANFVETERQIQRRLEEIDSKLQTKVSWDELLRSLGWLVTGLGLVLALMASIITSSAQFKEVSIGGIVVSVPVFVSIVAVVLTLVFLGFLRQSRKK